jgi:hypothetical protein
MGINYHSLIDAVDSSRYRVLVASPRLYRDIDLLMKVHEIVKIGGGPWVANCDISLHVIYSRSVSEGADTTLPLFHVLAILRSNFKTPTTTSTTPT